MYVHLQLFGKALLHVHNVMLCILSTNLVVITVVTDLEVINTMAMSVVMMTILHGKISQVSLQLLLTFSDELFYSMLFSVDILLNLRACSTLFV